MSFTPREITRQLLIGLSRWNATVETKRKNLTRLQGRIFFVCLQIIYNMCTTTSVQHNQNIKNEGQKHIFEHTDLNTVTHLCDIPGNSSWLTEVNVTCLAFPRCFLLLGVHRFAMHTDPATSSGNISDI